MSTLGVEQRFEKQLTEANLQGHFPWSMVCTEQGLLLASAGEGRLEHTAALACFFDEVLARATRDLDWTRIDEVALRDGDKGRLVLRPLGSAGGLRLFLAVGVPKGRTWRKITNGLVRTLAPVVHDLDQEYGGAHP